MRINFYDAEIGRDNCPVLVKEKSINYQKVDYLDSPWKIAAAICDVCRADKKAEEYTWLIALNTKCKPLGIFVISKGSATCALLGPREVFMRLLICGATNFALVHNHPSGDPHPSITDTESTKEIINAAKLFRINVLDHIIVGDNGNFFSYREEGLIK